MHILQRRKYIGGLPIIRSPRTIYLIYPEFRIVDSIDYTLILDDNARVVSVNARRATLTFFARNGQHCIENAIASINL